MKKKIVFISGTRADYGKLKAIMKKIETNDKFELLVFVTGMHMLSDYGSTYKEVIKDGFENIYTFINLRPEIDMDIALSNTISGFSNFVQETKPDLIVVHGDRIEAMAGAIVGAMNNIYVAHIEGGERSGTIDESLRHAITKLSHTHFVANEEAKRRIIQMGENEENVYAVGSPDIDVMLSENLPDIHETKERYEINFDHYGIVMFHPVTTSHKQMADFAKIFVDAIIESGDNLVVILPNNDWGRDFIIEEYERLKTFDRIKTFPSLRFEHFLSLLKNSEYIIGNSSAGVREAGIYAVPAIDVGNRQSGRYAPDTEGIFNTEYDVKQILQAIKKSKEINLEPDFKFGDGNSVKHIMDILEDDEFWNIEIQKAFYDI